MKKSVFLLVLFVILPIAVAVCGWPVVGKYPLVESSMPFGHVAVVVSDLRYAPDEPTPVTEDNRCWVDSYTESLLDSDLFVFFVRHEDAPETPLSSVSVSKEKARQRLMDRAPHAYQLFSYPCGREEHPASAFLRYLER